MSKRWLIFVWAVMMVLSTGPVYGQDAAAGSSKLLTLREFIDLAVANDTEFERILIDELDLQYEKDLNIDADDLVLEVKGQHDMMFSLDRKETGGSVGLSKLFPYTGTGVSAEYTTSASLTSTENSTVFNVEISQPIAGNAFGKATRLRDKIVGLEIDVAKHQVVEAYEDYLAAIIEGYYDWYEAYENLNVGRSSYNENLKLLDNIKERQQNNIALPIDVNKVNLQVLAKKEKLVELKETYVEALSFIENAVRHDGRAMLIPGEPELYRNVDVDFDRDFAAFRKASRTYRVLDLLEEKSTLEVDEEADDLLPSIDLLVGYNVRGRDFEIENEDNLFYTGVTMEWPFGDQVDRAEYEQAKIALNRTKLSNTGTHFQLYKEIKDLAAQIGREKELLTIASEKIGLARSILEDETENYSFGKVTLNDYIAAVNVLDTNRFNVVQHDILHKKLTVEWLRLTDQLISREEINDSQSKTHTHPY